MSDKPFAVQSIKIPLFNVAGAYNDLKGEELDTTLFTPWDDVLQSIADAGADSVHFILSVGALPRFDANDFDPGINYNPEIDVIRSISSLAQSKGLDVHIGMFTNLEGVISGDPDLAGQDRPHPTDLELWHDNYSERILSWAEFAEDIGATAYFPFEDVTQHLFQESQLLDNYLVLIDGIRERFSGILSTVWHSSASGEEITGIPSEVIAKLDYLGLGFFPKITEDFDASFSDLVDGYYSDVNGTNLIEYLRGLAERYNKPILISDKAFHSFDGAAVNETLVFNANIPLEQDLEEQRLLYDSFLTVFSQNSGDWFRGVAFQAYNNISDDADLVGRYTNGPLSESPQGKPAEQVLKEWFTGQRQGDGLVRSDQIQNNTFSGGYHHDRLEGGLGDDILRGFAGNDTLIGGPSTGLQANYYEIEVAVRGVLAMGESPTLRISDDNGVVLQTVDVDALVNASGGGQSANPTVISFRLPALTEFRIEQTNWAFFDFSDTGNRYARIESISVNGTSLDLSRFLTYQPSSSGPEVGSTDSNRGGRFDVNLREVSAAPLSGSFGDNDILEGGSGADYLVGGAGNDHLLGGDGLDVAGFSSAASLYSRFNNGSSWTISGPEGSDILDSVERLQFSDVKVALDFDGHAAEAARAIGVFIGPNAVADQALAGLVLGVLDSGTSYSELMSMAFAALGISDPEAGVRLLMTNLHGIPPSDAAVASAVADITGGATTLAGYAQSLADSDANAESINLVGLQDSGLIYI